MGLAYFTVMLASAITLRSPHPNYICNMNMMKTKNFEEEKDRNDVSPSSISSSSRLSSSQKGPTDAAVTAPTTTPFNMTVEAAMRAPDFYLVGLSFFCLSTGGYGLFSVAKPMMNGW